MKKIQKVTQHPKEGEIFSPDYSLDASLCHCSCTECEGCEDKMILYGWASAGAMTGAGIAIIIL